MVKSELTPMLISSTILSLYSKPGASESPKDTDIVSPSKEVSAPPYISKRSLDSLYRKVKSVGVKVMSAKEKSAVTVVSTFFTSPFSMTKPGVVASPNCSSITFSSNELFKDPYIL